MVLLNVASADPPNWVDDPGSYEHSATIAGGIILSGGTQIAGTDDLFAAFDDVGNVRGTAVQLIPPFGPFEGEIMYEMQLRSNIAGDILTFKYYDASEDVVLGIIENYTFIINDIVGDVIYPVYYNTNLLAINDDFQPLQYTLGQNYPNPYNPITHINYSIANLSNVVLRIYDIKGQLITELLSDIHMPGKYNKIWDSRYFATGIYFIDMKVYSIHNQLIYTAINKMLYLK